MLFLAGVCALDETLDYFQFSLSHEFDVHIQQGLMTAVVLLGWAMIWAGIGQVVRHQPQFKNQIGAVALAYLIPLVLITLGRFVQFPINHSGFDRIFGWGVALISLAVLLKLNLYFATNLKNTTVPAVVTAASIGLLSYIGIHYTGDEELEYRPVYPQTLLPPVVNVRPPTSIDDYIARVDRRLDDIEHDAANRGED